MKVIFLGTNGWYDSQTGNTVCTLIDTEEEFVILDAGNGLYKIDRYIKTRKPIYIFLSHLHLDHIVGLHILGKFKFPQGIDIFGRPGLKKNLKRIINRPYTIPLNKLNTRIRLYELNKKPETRLKFTFRKLLHSSLCYGYRFYLQNKIISYCLDTGVCKNLFLLAQDADLLIAECSLRCGQINKNWPHLNPEQAANIAKSSRVKRLILLHFDASVYTKEGDIRLAEESARKIFKNTVAARDGYCLKI
jgi:ribonuclease BN (tRNA processing enzyme)